MTTNNSRAAFEEWFIKDITEGEKQAYPDEYKEWIEIHFPKFIAIAAWHASEERLLPVMEQMAEVINLTPHRKDCERSYMLLEDKPLCTCGKEQALAAYKQVIGE